MWKDYARGGGQVLEADEVEKLSKMSVYRKNLHPPMLIEPDRHLLQQKCLAYLFVWNGYHIKDIQRMRHHLVDIKTGTCPDGFETPTLIIDGVHTKRGLVRVASRQRIDP